MDLPQASQRVVESAAAKGVEIEIRQFPDGTRTAEEAAAAIGCEIACIVKSLVFTVDGEPVVALVPGDRRLDPALLARAAGGQEADRASLDVVRRATGFVAGGTPPFGHDDELRIFADEPLRQGDTLWAAGGTPTTVFSLTPAELDRLSAPTWAPLS